MINYSVALEIEYEKAGNARKTRDGNFYLFTLATKLVNDKGEVEVVARTKGFRLRKDFSYFLLPRTEYRGASFDVVEMAPKYREEILEWFKQNQHLFS